MQYMILIYSDEAAWGSMKPEDMEKEFGKYMQYSKELAASGCMRGGASLQPTATATSVRVRNGKTSTTDGPFAETKEQLGGYYIIEAASLDEAVKWAAKCPGANYGTCEVRPLGVISDDAGGVAAQQ